MANIVRKHLSYGIQEGKQTSELKHIVIMAIQMRYKEKKRTEKKKNLSDLWDRSNNVRNL